MNRTGAVITVLGLALVLGFMAWTFHVSSGFSGSWTGGNLFLGLMIAFGVVATGGLGALLMWLAFYSARKGFDDDSRPKD